MKIIAMDGEVIDALCTVSCLQSFRGTNPTLFELVDITERGGEASLSWLNRPDPDIDEVRKLASRILTDAQRCLPLHY